MLLWSGWRVRALTTQDLAQAIDAPPGLTGYLDRLWQLVSAITLTRKQKLALVIVAAAACLMIVRFKFWTRGLSHREASH